jgi:hypothetical protein
MAIEAVIQFPGELSPRPEAYARHEGSLARCGKGQNENIVFMTYYRDAEHRQAAGVIGMEDGISIPAQSEDVELQAMLEDRLAILDSLKAVEYSIAKKLRPALGAGEDLL